MPVAETQTAVSALAKLRKTHGNIGGLGAPAKTPGRYRTGVLAFDVATGGGFPRNRFTLLWGKESSGKTNFALLAIAAQQQSDPHLTPVIIDVEGTVTQEWAEALGVDWERVIYIRVSTAEEAMDVACQMVAAEDVGIVLLDSIAAMTTNQEVEADYDAQSPGTHGRTMGKFIRLAGKALKDAVREGGESTLICVNQVRHKIGVMHGSPETLPGGMGQQFAASLSIRVYGKNVMDAQYHDKLPVWKEITIKIKKNKIPVCEEETKVRMALLPAGQFRPGQSNDWPVAKRHMEELGLMVKAKSGVEYLGTPFPTQKAMWEWLNEDPARMADLTQRIVAERVPKFEKAARTPVSKKKARKKAAKKAKEKTDADAE